MSVIHIPRRYLNQPQGYVRAAADDGLIAAFSGADLTYDAVSGERGTIAGSAAQITPLPTINGLATDFNPSAIAAVMLPTPIVFNGLSSWSIFVRFRNDVETANGMLLGEYNTPESRFRVDRGGVRFVYTPKSGAEADALSGQITADWHDLTISWEVGGTLTIFYDGRLRNTATGKGGHFIFDSFGYAYNSLTFMFDGAVEGCLVRNRASSLEEHIADRGVGMYRLFRADPIRIYSLPSGPVSVSWSSLTASNMTPTSATLTLGGITR